MSRLRLGLKRLKIPFPDFEQLNQEVYLACREHQLAVLKIIISRGIGDRGYQLPQFCAPMRVVAVLPHPEYPDYDEEGIGLKVCNTRLGIQPMLAGIKHLNRLEQVLARSEWQSDRYQEGLMADIDDNLIEGTHSNVFFCRGYQIFTPQLDRCGVAGVMRDRILSHIKHLGLELTVGRFPLTDIYSASEVFICNSLIGIWPVVQIEEQRFEIGKITRALQRALQHLDARVLS